MVQARTRKMRLDFVVGDRTRAGLASVNRSVTSTLGGINREAGALAGGVTSLMMGNVALFGAAAGAAVVGFAGASMSTFMEVERQWAEVMTLMPQAHKRATDQMLADVRAYSRESGFILRDTISATYQAVSAGIDPSQAPEFLGVAGTAARAGITDLTTSVDVLTSVLNAYSLEVGHATNVSDAMFTAIRLGKTTLPELSVALGPVLPIAASLNTEFNELTASVAALTAMGNQTPIAVTQIRSALVALSKDTEARSIFESAMGMTYAEYQAQGGTLQEALQIIVDEANRTGQSVVDVFGRVEAANAALALTVEKGSNTFVQAMNVTSGAAVQAAETIEQTTAVKAEQVKAWWTDVKLTVGGVITDITHAVLATFGILEEHSSETRRAIKTTAQHAARDWRHAWDTIAGVDTRTGGPSLEDVAPDISLGDGEPTMTIEEYQASLRRSIMEWQFGLFSGTTATGVDYHEGTRSERFRAWMEARYPGAITNEAGTGWGLTNIWGASTVGQEAAGADAALIAGIASGAITEETIGIIHDQINKAQEENPDLFTSPELLRAGGAGTEDEAMMNLRLSRYQSVIDSLMASVDATGSNTEALDRNTQAINNQVEWTVTRDEQVDEGVFIGQRRDTVRQVAQRVSQRPPSRTRSG